MREIRKSGSEGGGGREASSYLYHTVLHLPIYCAAGFGGVNCRILFC